MGKVHDLLVETLLESKGRVLSNKKIIELVLTKFPGSVKAHSIVVKDHAKPRYPRAPNCKCIDDEEKRLFDWLGRGQYKVRHYN